jgi:hypothetical protein
MRPNFPFMSTRELLLYELKTGSRELGVLKLCTIFLINTCWVVNVDYYINMLIVCPLRQVRQITLCSFSTCFNSTSVACACWPKCYHVLNWFFLPKPGFLEFIWIFSDRNHFLNQYLPHSESKSYQINSIKSLLIKIFLTTPKAHSNSSEIFSYNLI